MNTNGEAAEQVTRIILEGTEVLLRLSGKGAARAAVLLYTTLRQQEKTKGAARLSNMLRSGKPLRVYTFESKDLPKFKEVAKQYGVLYPCQKICPDSYACSAFSFASWALSASTRTLPMSATHIFTTYFMSLLSFHKYFFDFAFFYLGFIIQDPVFCDCLLSLCLGFGLCISFHFDITGLFDCYRYSIFRIRHLLAYEKPRGFRC